MGDNRAKQFVSICVPDAGPIEYWSERLAKISSDMDERFRYWELVIVLEEDAATKIHTLADRLAVLRNLRIVVVAAGTGYYRRRYVAAFEAIGDVVALVDLHDINLEWLADEIVTTFERQDVAIGRSCARPFRRPVYGLLSIMSENHITPRATRILLLSRDRLSQILSRANAPIDLRFEPKNGTSRYRWFDLPKSAAESRSSSRESSLELGVQLIMAGAPRYLKAFAGLSVVTAFAAFLYAMYAVAAFVFLPHLQPGWFSSSIFQAGSVGFMSLGMTVFSLALVSIHERQNTGDIDVVLREVGNTSFFEHSADTIVELASSSIASSNDRN